MIERIKDEEVAFFNDNGSIHGSMNVPQIINNKEIKTGGLFWQSIPINNEKTLFSFNIKDNKDNIKEKGNELILYFLIHSVIIRKYLKKKEKNETMNTGIFNNINTMNNDNTIKNSLFQDNIENKEFIKQQIASSIGSLVNDSNPFLKAKNALKVSSVFSYNLL